MVQKISSELHVVAATPEMEKAIAAELAVEDGDIVELLKKVEDDERSCSEDNTKNLS